MFDELENTFTTMLQSGNLYVNEVVGGNEFAAGMVIAGVLGTMTYLLRSVPMRMFEFVKRHTTTELALNSTDTSFHLMMKFFEISGLSARARSIRINNGAYGDGDMIKGLGYGSQWFWYKGNPLFITVRKEDSTSSNVKEFVIIKRLGRSHKLFDELMADVKESKDSRMTAYYQYSYGKDHLVDQPKQTIDNVVLRQDTRDEITNIIDNFVQKEEWYKKHNIPYQLGILLYGPPGTGKTTLIRAIAGYLNKDVVLVTSAENLASAALAVSDSVIVVDEVDTFGLAKRGESRYDSVGGSPILRMTRMETEEKTPADSFSEDLKKIGLSKVLTSLDGVVSNHGRIVIMCTNHIETLDTAMIRPGRIDAKIEIGFLDKETFGMMLDKFFGVKDRVLDILDEVSPADIQNDVIMNMTEEQIVEKYTKH